MARETRRLRPFETLSETQRWMSESVQITAHHPDQRAATHNQRLVLDPDDYVEAPIVLWFDRNSGRHDEAAKAVYEEITELYPKLPGIVDLVVSVANKRLKMTELLLDRPITTAADLPFAIDLHQAGPEKSRPGPLMTPGDGCEVVVELVLGRDLLPAEREPFRAWRKGSWLARVAIGVSTSGATSGPRPLALTEAVREAKNVPSNALHYTHVFAPRSVLTAESFDDILEFYVDEEVLDQVSDHPLEAWSRRTQVGWILDVIKTVVMLALRDEAFPDFEPTDAQWSGTILRAVLDKVAESPDVGDLATALAMLTEEPWRFFAILEDRTDLLALERSLVPLDLVGGDR